MATEEVIDLRRKTTHTKALIGSFVFFVTLGTLVIGSWPDRRTELEVWKTLR